MYCYVYLCIISYRTDPGHVRTIIKQTVLIHIIIISSSPSPLMAWSLGGLNSRRISKVPIERRICVTQILNQQPDRSFISSHLLLLMIISSTNRWPHSVPPAISKHPNFEKDNELRLNLANEFPWAFTRRRLSLNALAMSGGRHCSQIPSKR